MVVLIRTIRVSSVGLLDLLGFLWMSLYHIIQGQHFGSDLAPLQYPSFYLSHILSKVAVNLRLKFFYMCIDMCMNNLTNESMGIEWKTYALFQISYTVLINISTKTAISVLGGLVVMMLIWIVRD